MNHPPDVMSKQLHDCPVMSKKLRPLISFIELFCEQSTYFFPQFSPLGEGSEGIVVFFSRTNGIDVRYLS